MHTSPRTPRGAWSCLAGPCNPASSPPPAPTCDPPKEADKHAKVAGAGHHAVAAPARYRVLGAGDGGQLGAHQRGLEGHCDLLGGCGGRRTGVVRWVERVGRAGVGLWDVVWAGAAKRWRSTHAVPMQCTSCTAHRSMHLFTHGCSPAVQNIPPPRPPPTAPPPAPPPTWVHSQHLARHRLPRLELAQRLGGAHVGGVQHRHQRPAWAVGARSTTFRVNPKHAGVPGAGTPGRRVGAVRLQLA